MINYLTLFLVCILSLSSQRTPAGTFNEDNLTELLVQYAEHNLKIQGVDWMDRLKFLASRNIDIVEFHDAVLRDIHFVDFWGDAVCLLALKDSTKPEVVAKKTIEFVNREEKVMVDGVREAKIWGLLILLDLVRPDLDDNPDRDNVVRVLEDFVCRDEMITSTYWAGRFDLNELRKKPRTSLNWEELKSVLKAESAASICIDISGSLYHLTNEGKSKSVLEKGLISNEPVIKGKSEFFLSGKLKKAWSEEPSFLKSKPLGIP